MEKPVISGIAFTRDEAKIIVRGRPGHSGHCLQDPRPGECREHRSGHDRAERRQGRRRRLYFTVHRNDFARAQEALRKASDELGNPEIIGDDKIAKVSLVGVGMRSHAGCGLQDV